MKSDALEVQAVPALPVTSQLTLIYCHMCMIDILFDFHEKYNILG